MRLDLRRNDWLLAPHYRVLRHDGHGMIEAASPDGCILLEPPRHPCLCVQCRLYGDGLSCTDIDECSAGTDNCDVNASCTNSEGGFACACNPPYAGNGVTCSVLASDGDGIFDTEDACPAENSEDRDLDADGCEDDCESLAATVEGLVTELEALPAPSSVLRRLALRAAIRLLEQAAGDLHACDLTWAVAELEAAAMLLVQAGSHAEDGAQLVADVLRILAYQAIAAALSDADAVGRYLTRATDAYEAGLEAAAAGEYDRASLLFGYAWRQAARALR